MVVTLEMLIQDHVDKRTFAHSSKRALHFLPLRGKLATANYASPIDLADSWRLRRSGHSWRRSRRNYRIGTCFDTSTSRWYFNDANVWWTAPTRVCSSPFLPSNYICCHRTGPVREYIGNRRRFCVALGERSVPNRTKTILYVMVRSSPSSTQRQIRDNLSYATYTSGKDGVHSPKMSFRFRSATAVPCVWRLVYLLSWHRNASGYVR